eukprot:154504-Chlamydomonas_euryale.AAC.4
MEPGLGRASLVLCCAGQAHLGTGQRSGHHVRDAVANCRREVVPCHAARATCLVSTTHPAATTCISVTHGGKCFKQKGSDFKVSSKRGQVSRFQAKGVRFQGFKQKGSGFKVSSKRGAKAGGWLWKASRKSRAQTHHVQLAQQAHTTCSDWRRQRHALQPFGYGAPARDAVPAQTAVSSCPNLAARNDDAGRRGMPRTVISSWRPPRHASRPVHLPHLPPALEHLPAERWAEQRCAAALAGGSSMGGPVLVRPPILGWHCWQLACHVVDRRSPWCIRHQRNCTSILLTSPAIYALRRLDCRQC